MTSYSVEYNTSSTLFSSRILQLTTSRAGSTYTVLAVKALVLLLKYNNWFMEIPYLVYSPAMLPATPPSYRSLGTLVVSDSFKGFELRGDS
jgi:hypothetical protein